VSFSHGEFGERISFQEFFSLDHSLRLQVLVVPGLEILVDNLINDCLGVFNLDLGLSERVVVLLDSPYLFLQNVELLD